MEMTKKHNACDCFGEENLYRIGMFAAMNHVTVKTLRFYEEQGLLLPAYINEENGYRYYRMNQMAVVHKITALKKAGFSLEDIARINACSDEKAVLNKKKSDLLCKIAKLTKQIAILDGYLANKGSSLSAPVLLKTIPEVTVAAVERRIESYDCLFEIMPQAGELMELAECECQNPEYCFTNYLEPVCKEGDILVEICQAVTGMKMKVDGLNFKVMPEIQAACVYHKGSYASMSETYECVLNYIEENGYRIVGSIREKYIDGVWNKEDESQWLTEIQIPVEKKEE